ncbi:histidine decarboxylase [Streptomyces sp. NPDC058961]|uniref:histidine decarboxylase n=1 Tax=Streptomyces sp. NPDC058961 TaxID=3346680 RepID=UPI0036BB7E3E
MPILTSGDLKIGERPRTPQGARQDRELLTKIAEEMRSARDHMVGFPVNLDFDHQDLAPFLAVHGNNVGSPDRPSEYHLHSKFFERSVVDFFADLTAAPEGGAFGYVTSGGTESNLYGLYLGRERHPDAVLYASAAAHYSIPKIARLLRIDHVPVDVDDEGAIDLPALRAAATARPERAALAVVTVGTTGRGAVDDLPGVDRTLAEAGVRRRHLHVDGAFGGLLAALAPHPRPWAFDAGADSIAISGHKMIGSPMPCGVVLARQQDVMEIRVPGVAVGSDDDTIGGSRDALAPILLWRELRRLGRQGLAERVRNCLLTADYATERLEACGARPTHPAGTNTVLFDAPRRSVCDRWNLLRMNGRAHLITMPHVTREHVDRLCSEITDVGNAGS